MKLGKSMRVQHSNSLPKECEPKRSHTFRNWVQGVFAIAVLLLSAESLAQAQALWSGQIQCRLTIQSEGYAHQEIQEWKLSGEPPTFTGNMPVYPAAWTVTGQGSAQRSNYSTKLTSQWKSASSPMTASLAIFKRASDQRLVIKRYTPGLRAPGGVTIGKTVAAPGAAASQSSVQMDAWEWPLPVIEDAGSSTDVSGSGTVMIAGTSMPMQAPATSPANCTWHFVVGANAPASAPANKLPSIAPTAPPSVANTTTLAPTQVASPPAQTGNPSSSPSTTLPSEVASTVSKAPIKSQMQPPPPPQSPLKVTNASSACNTAGSFSVYYAPSAFLSGETTVDFGSDITILGTTVQDPHTLTAQLLIPSSATPGSHTVTVKVGTKTISGPGAFTVTSPCAQSQSTPLAFTPASGVQNEANITVHVQPGVTVTAQGGPNFIQGLTMADFGDGITVNSINVAGPHAADVNISISPTAYAGNHQVTMKTANENGSGSFTVARAGNVTLSLPVATAQCNFVGSFDIKASAAHFLSGVSQVDFGPDITVAGATVQNPNLLTAQLYVPAGASQGPHNVTVTTGGETASLASGFTVTSPCAATQGTNLSLLPNAVTPSQGVRGEQNMTIRIRGAAGLVQGVTRADFGPEITVNSVTVTTANDAEVNISIPSTAHVTQQNFTLTTANNSARGQFEVLDGGSKHLFTLSTATAQCNFVGAFPIGGQNTNFAQGITTVDFGPDITVENVTVTNSANLTAQLYIPPGATPGARTVTVTTGAEVASLASGFTVNTPCAAKQNSATYISPGFGVVGVQNMIVHVGGTGLVQGLTTADFGEGITVNSVTVTDSGADVNISIASNAQHGGRNVTLTTANSVMSAKANGSVAFEVMQ